MSDTLQPSRHSTLWRQGSLLTGAAHQDITGSDGLAVVISHDCDLAADESTEPSVELILGSFIEDGCQSNGLVTGRSHRCLHLEFIDGCGNARYVSISVGDKHQIEKKKLMEHEPDGRYNLSEKSRRLLSSWLASRYRRHALPDTLNNRLSRAYKAIDKKGKTKSQGVIATFLSYDPMDELDFGEPYEISIKVVYEHLEPAGLGNANALVDTIRTALNKTDENELFIGDISAVSDTEFTLFDQTTMVELKYEYLSFRGEHPGKLIE